MGVMTFIVLCRASDSSVIRRLGARSIYGFIKVNVHCTGVQCSNQIIVRILFEDKTSARQSRKAPRLYCVITRREAVTQSRELFIESHGNQC